MSNEQIQGGDVPDIASADSDYLRTVVKTDVAEKFIDLIGPELDRAHAMASRSEDEVEELKWKMRQRHKLFLASYPPKNSKNTGVVRKYLVGDEKEPLSDLEKMEINMIYDVAESRATLGRNAELLELVSKITQVQRMEKSEETEGESGAKSDLKKMLGM
jgi:hypothetical protein